MTAPDSWIAVDAESLTVSWQSLATMVTISSSLVAVAVVYLRLFVDGRLLQFKQDISHDIRSAEFLGKQVGYVKLGELERRIAKVEDDDDDD